MQLASVKGKYNRIEVEDTAGLCERYVQQDRGRGYSWPL
jgi:hypothetical protein